MGAPIDLVNGAHATEEKKTDCGKAVTMIEATTVKEVAIPEKWRVNRALATNEEEQTDCDKDTHFSGVISVMGFAAKNLPWLES